MTDETGNWPTWVKKTIAVVAVAAVGSCCFAGEKR